MAKTTSKPTRIVLCTLADQRDSQIDTRIAEFLGQMGYDAMVRRFAIAGMDAVIYERPDIIVLPMVGSDHKLDFARRCHEWGVHAIVRRGEAGMARESLEAATPERQTIVVGHYDYADYVDLELVWGQPFADILAERGRMPAEKLVACGPFTLDMAMGNPPARRQGPKKRLLFATAWSGADDDEHYTECGLPAESPFQGQMFQYHTQMRKVWIQTIRDLYLSFGHKYELYVKVRPGESAAPYVVALGDKATAWWYDTPSAKAIAESDLVIHAGSTMAVEAHLMGIPTICYTNCNPDPRLAAVAPQAEDFAQLTDVLGKVHWGYSNADADAVRWLEDNLYGPMDGKACLRAAQAIDRYAKQRAHRAMTIPNAWPRDVRFPTEGVSTERKEGTEMVHCMSCHGVFYKAPSASVVFCPYCGLTLRAIHQRAVKVA